MLLITCFFLSRPYILIGHSNGNLVMYKLISELKVSIIQLTLNTPHLTTMPSTHEPLGLFIVKYKNIQ